MSSRFPLKIIYNLLRPRFVQEPLNSKNTRNMPLLQDMFFIISGFLKSRRMCSPPHPKGKKERDAAGARRVTLFLSFFCRRRR